MSLKKNFQVQGHSEMNGIRKFSKSRGTVKKVLKKILSLGAEWKNSFQKLLLSPGAYWFFCIQNFISYQVTIIKQFIQLEIKSKSLGPRQHKQQVIHTLSTSGNMTSLRALKSNIFQAISEICKRSKENA